MLKVELPEMAKGDWKIEKFTLKSADLYSMFHGRGIPAGTYTRLMRNGTVIMSDTPAECDDHRPALWNAEGSCLINGLGIGMILKNILTKPEVTDVTVVELSQDLIDLVAPHYNDPRVTIVCADALKYMPPEGKHYGMVWHDIWDNMCADNLKDMNKLQRKYRDITDWQGFWGKEACLRQKRESDRWARRCR